jgi:hypothetical protein
MVEPCEPGSAYLSACESESLATFRFGQSAPDAVRLSDLKGVVAALTSNRANLANSLGSNLSSLPFFLLLLRTGREEEVGVVAATQGNWVPRSIQSRHKIRPSIFEY